MDSLVRRFVSQGILKLLQSKFHRDMRRVYQIITWPSGTHLILYTVRFGGHRASILFPDSQDLRLVWIIS